MCCTTNTTSVTQRILWKDKTVLWVTTFFVSLFVLPPIAAAAQQQATQVTGDAAAGGQLPTSSHQPAADWSVSVSVYALKIICLADKLLNAPQQTRVITKSRTCSLFSK
ncbi:hypothetical protein AMECASPLE_017586 [Ameca splendens]|uniref:Uncharacterized protein n=1 Tax=Ameca splendens TaxID=208324 RepID=A0ABV0YPF4_9TELE